MDVLEGFSVVDGEDAEETLSCPHVLVPHGTVLFLTSSVQNVQQTRLAINHHLLSVRVLKMETGTKMVYTSKMHPYIITSDKNSK